jgi:hypothetical protein
MVHFNQLQPRCPTFYLPEPMGATRGLARQFMACGNGVLAGNEHLIADFQLDFVAICAQLGGIHCVSGGRQGTELSRDFCS